MKGSDFIQRIDVAAEWCFDHPWKASTIFLGSVLVLVTVASCVA